MLILNCSRHLGHFKRMIGQTNQYLITILIGLEGVRTGEVVKGESFKVSWKPESLEETTKRSRIFVRNAALAWTIDSLDAYLGFLRKQSFDFSSSFTTDIANERSVFKMLKMIIEFAKYPDDLPLSIVQLGIQWRNNLVHYHATNELEEKYASLLRNVKIESIQDRFRGLDPELMLKNFKENNSPTFKEVAAIVQSTHYLVLELDDILKEYLNLKIIIEEIIKENATDIDKIVLSHPENKLRKMKQYLITKGFIEVEKTISKAKIEDSEIEKIIEKEYNKRKEVRDNK
jgi:hypothetical protein